MAFSEELKAFQNTHPFSTAIVDGIEVNYLLCGNESSKITLVYLVGGTGFSVVWFNHIRQMEKDYRILTFDYPVQINDMEQLADFTIRFVAQLKIQNPLFLGASLGGFLAQLIMRKYPNDDAAYGLYSTSALSASAVKDLMKQYKSYGVMLALMKIVPYSWIRKILINVSKKMVGVENEAEQDRKYMEDFFEWVYRNYTKEFDIHMTTLMVSIAKIKPITEQEYKKADKNVLLVLPTDDKAFSEAAMNELISHLPNAMVTMVTGGHTATLYKVDTYVESTRKFIEEKISI